MEVNHHLVTDDNDLNRMVISILLEKNGIKVDEAENGFDAIDKIKHDLNKYSIIWLDLEMPLMDGAECSLKLKNELNYKGTIVGITSHADCESISTCKLAGMDTVLVKPITEENLLKNVQLFSKK